MSALEWLAWSSAACSAVPCLVFGRNLRRFGAPRASTSSRTDGARAPRVSVLIPARNEEHAIERAMLAALQSRDAEVEVVVGDDSSSDRTAEVVAAVAARDPRAYLERIPPLEGGWCGKQWACARLAKRARFDLLLFVDADVRLEPDAVARSVGFLEESGAALVSGFPRQITVTWLERLLLPLIHFVLLGWLPMGRMRRSLHPSYGAGCGQLMLVRRREYERAGGHGAIRASLHDGVQLPRALRRSGAPTDLFDATRLASCRMYRSASEVWRGLLKNASEGLAAPRAILPASLLLGWGQVAPVPLLLIAWARPELIPALAAGLAMLLCWLPRLLGALRFAQPLSSALLHPLGVLLLLSIQWQAFFQRALGRPAAWKGRSYSAGASTKAARSTV